MHARGTVPPNNTNPGICYSEGPLKIQRAPQNIVEHVSVDATVQQFVPKVHPFGAFEVVDVIHTLTSLLSLLGWESRSKMSH